MSTNDEGQNVSPNDAKPNVSSSYSWVSVDDKLPEVEDYYAVKFRNGDEDEKPFRIRPSKNIRGFMTEQEVTHWAAL